MCYVEKWRIWKEVLGGGNEQKNNNLSYIVTDFRSVINLAHIGFFDVKKVWFDTQEYFHEFKNEVKLDHTLKGDKGHQTHSAWWSTPRKIYILSSNT